MGRSVLGWHRLFKTTPVLVNPGLDGARGASEGAERTSELAARMENGEKTGPISLYAERGDPGSHKSAAGASIRHPIRTQSVRARFTTL